MGTGRIHYWRLTDSGCGPESFGTLSGTSVRYENCYLPRFPTGQPRPKKNGCVFSDVCPSKKTISEVKFQCTEVHVSL